MGSRDDDHVKRREIHFSAPHPDPHQAATAAVVLAEVDGVVHAEAVDPLVVHVHYHITHTCLAILEGTLEGHGLHLDNSLLAKLKRALAHFTEDTERDNLGCPRGESNCTTQVFIARYQHKPHGCRDDRPKHWRRYL